MDYWKRRELFWEAMRRIEAATLDGDYTELDERDVRLLLSELSYHEGQGYAALQVAYRAVLSHVRARYKPQIQQFDMLRTFEAWSDWEYSFKALVVADATMRAELRGEDVERRSPCPLCNGTPEQVFYKEGFTLPLGLKRHLDGHGRVERCDVMTVLNAINVDRLRRK